MQDRTWILASNSPRRKELLTLFQQPFAIHPADVDEEQKPGEKPADYVCRLAGEKSAAIELLYPEQRLILAADTTVALANDIFGKPNDAIQARTMLQQLRGQTHQVYTAISVRYPQLKITKKALCCSDVPMREFSDAEIDEYIASGDPFDKAGGYAIQHSEFHPVQNFRGCFASVMGLPLCHLAYLLGKIGLMPDVAIDVACQGYLGYDCPIHADVLRGENIG